MNFEELTRQVGFPLAVVIHSQQIPIDDDFWDNVTFDQWQEVRRKLSNEDHVCNEYVLNRMRQKAQTFRHIATLYSLASSSQELAELVAQGVEKASTFSDWRWVYSITDDPVAKEMAFVRMKAAPSTFGDWIDTYLDIDRHAERGDILCAKASTQAEWLDLYRRWSNSITSPVYAKCRQRLEELVPTFAGWKEIYEEREDVSPDPIVTLALEMMTQRASTIRQCHYVLNHASGKTRVTMLGKIERMDGAFADWQWLFENNRTLTTIALHRMAGRAAAMREWQFVYENSYQHPELHRQALEEMTKLAAAEPVVA